MRALGWDDNPEEYFEQLKEHLQDLNIDLTIFDSEKECAGRLSKEPQNWDVLITDFLNESAPGDEQVGARLSKLARAHDIPAYMITHHYNRTEMNIGDEVVVKSKRTPAVYVANEIKRDLVQRGAFRKRDTVGILYGRNLQARRSLEKFLRSELKLNVELVTENVPESSAITTTLKEKFHSCAAVIAICSGDDEIDDAELGTIFQPRQNVMLEMGLVLGFNDGEQRLITIKEEKATIPSNVRGRLALTYSGNIDEAFPALAERLQERGIGPREDGD